jgi:hypothetical protein
MKAVNIELPKDSENKSYATEEQIALLDQVNQHLKVEKKSIKTFIRPSEVTVLPPSENDTSEDTVLLPSDSDTSEVTVLSPSDSDSDGDTNELIEVAPIKTVSPKPDSSQYNQLSFLENLMEVGIAIANKIKSPLENYRELEEAIKNKWLLPTSTVVQLVGAKPVGKEWVRGSFRFVRRGKIGQESAWLVERVI